jgi:hypothetical protein
VKRKLTAVNITLSEQFDALVTHHTTLAHARTHTHAHAHTYPYRVSSGTRTHTMKALRTMLAPYTVSTKVCHSGVTVVLHCCYTVVTVVLHCCYTVVTLVLHCCYTVVTLWLHWCYTVRAQKIMLAPFAVSTTNAITTLVLRGARLLKLARKRNLLPLSPPQSP